MPYIVIVDDNFHYMEEDERYTLGEFADAAVAAVATVLRRDWNHKKNEAPHKAGLRM